MDLRGAVRAFIGFSDDTSGALAAARAGFGGLGRMKREKPAVVEVFARPPGPRAPGPGSGGPSPRREVQRGPARADLPRFRRSSKNSGHGPARRRDFLHDAIAANGVCGAIARFARGRWRSPSCRSRMSRAGLVPQRGLGGQRRSPDAAKPRPPDRHPGRRGASDPIAAGPLRRARTVLAAASIAVSGRLTLWSGSVR